MTDFMKRMQEIYGEKGLDERPSRREILIFIDAIKSALLKQQDRLDALDGGSKPRVRVGADKSLHFQTEGEYRAWLSEQRA